MRILLCLTLLLSSLTAVAARGQAPPLPLGQGERVLFLGDDLTQQMFFSRAAAACLLAMQPTADLRFYNGGKDGATAGEAVTWARPLMELTKPTLVVICFGLNDAMLHEADQYELDLSNLIATVRQYPSMQSSARLPGAGVIVMSPPALPHAEVGPKLRQFTDIAQHVAQTEHAAFVDIQRPMRKLYDSADDKFSKQLTLGDRLPSELTHMMIASELLSALGVTGPQVDAVDWSPLPPMEMGRIRPHLAWADTRAAEAELAGQSRRLYLSLTRCDELFFRLWRLLPSPEVNNHSQENPNGQNNRFADVSGERTTLEKQLEQAWASAIQQATVFSGLSGD